MERIKNNNILRKTGALFGLIGTIGLAGCEGPNHTGKGNEFTIMATVDHSGKYSVTIDEQPQKILKENGRAIDWFADNEPHQIHNHYKDGSDGCETKQFVGKILDASGVEEKLSDLKPGDDIVIEGFISESSKTGYKGGCTTENRPVFTRVVDYGPNGLDSRIKLPSSLITI